MSDERSTKRDMVLPPGTYAYMQDVTKGVIKTYTGPTVINPTAQEVPVIYDPEKGRFEKVDLESAVRRAIIAPEGFYIILLNPAQGGKNAHPEAGTTQPSADLDVGRKIVIPGPAMFPLWPGQAAHTIRGHQIRFNQYILARVYNEEEAQKNWKQAVMKPATGAVGATGGDGAEGDDKMVAAQPQDFTVGTEIIIRGDQVSFYIPPTGIAVVKDGDKYVRDALTLERLEYSILIDEDGNKRYEEGPQVVFPRPSERFVESKGDDGRPTKKFRAIELNEIQGLHIKVIADYTENGKVYKAGDEIFITGKDTAIYYPREEHSAIKYDGKAKHFATAIPAGEARYVMNRKNGEIRTVKGPAMLLPDPRTEVIIRRTLSDKQATLWYPGNNEVKEYNEALRSLLASVPTTRQGVLSEGDITRGSKRGGTAATNSKSLVASVENRTTGLISEAFASNVAPAAMESSKVGGDQGFVGEEFSRASSYSQPRTVDLNTKYQGAPTIDIWTGYACMVVSKQGRRRVEKGPGTIILDYDEGLEVLELSTGKPKTTDTLLRTVYLRVDNNKVSDKIQVETSDHVQVEIYLSHNINFDANDQLKWFSVENYIKFACDRIRSILKGAVRKLKVEEFYASSTDIIRDVLLGKQTTAEAKRPGLRFEENGMVLTDVEVLKVHLLDERIRNLLDQSQQDVVRSNIEMSTLRRNQDILVQKEDISRQEMVVKAETKKISDQTSMDLLTSKLALSLTSLANQLQEIQKQKDNQAAQEDLANIQLHGKLGRDSETARLAIDIEKQKQQQRIDFLVAETEATVARFASAQGGFSEALVALSNKDTLVKVAEAWSIQRAIGGENLSDALTRVFAGTPLVGLVKKIAEKSVANGSTPVMPTIS